MDQLFIENSRKIRGLQCKISSGVHYCPGKTGVIKGIKELKSETAIYLIEFSDYNRVWAMKQELDLL